MERDGGKAGARSFCSGCEGNEQEAMLLHLAIEGALNILTPPWYLLKPSCFSHESPCSILQSCCTFHYYMQPSCVQVSSAFVEPCLLHVPVTNIVTVLVVPQMLWAAAS